MKVRLTNEGGFPKAVDAETGELIRAISADIHMGPREVTATLRLDNPEIEVLCDANIEGTAAESREQLAALAHAQWSGWMVYLFNMSESNGDGTVTIPAGLVARWQGQIATPYQELSDREKDSDRVEADKVLALFEASRS